MNRYELTDIIYRRHGGISRKEAADIVNLILSKIKNRLLSGERVESTGFGPVCPRAHNDPSLITLLNSSKLSMSPGSPFPFVIFSTICSIRFVPSRQGVH